jgi:hypothetical protein
MADNYMDKINLIHNLLISSSIIQKSVEKIPQIDIDKYILDIGSILYENGIIKGEYTLFPYDIFIERGTNDTICFKIAITFGIEVDSRNYKSKYSRNPPPIKIRKGVIIMGRCKYLYDMKSIELKDINYMPWNTDLKLQELKDKVQWEPYLYPHLSNTPNNINKIYQEYNKERGVILERHEIDNDVNNNMCGNIVMVTPEQHAAIHLYMWDKYILEDNFLKNPFYKKY